MNEYLLSIILGVVEGLTEFLPVSSTAHLRIAEQLLGMDLASGYWKMYTIVIQLGAVLAVVAYFWGRLWGFVRTFPAGPAADPDAARLNVPPGAVPATVDYEAPPPVRRTAFNHPLTLVLGAFVVTAGPAYLLDKKIGENLENFWVIGTALVVGGIAMWAIDFLFVRPRTTTLEQITWPQAIVIGAAQILSAAFPGTSRSMSTIAAGQVMGLSRAAALEFSFFLSIPVMCAATGFKLFQATVLHKGFGPEPLVMNGHRWGVLAVGFLVSFAVALLVIAWFMAWVRRRGFAPFAIYRIVVGAAVLAMAWKARGA